MAAGVPISFYRGNEADLPVLPDGRPAFTLDTHKLFVGAGGVNYEIGGSGGVSDGDKGDIVVSSSGAVWEIDDAVVGLDNLADINGPSVLGRAAEEGGPVEEITAGTSGHVLRLSGTTLGFGTVATAGIGDGQVTYAKLQNMTGLSVLGRSANSTGVTAEITAANDGEVLRRSGTSIAFGTIGASGISLNAVSYDRLQDVTATKRVIGRNTAGSGDPEEVTVSQLLDWANGSAADGHLLARSGGAWTTRTLAGTDLPQRHNLLANGGGWFWTRQSTPGTLTSYSDDAYGPDRWYVLTQTASVQLARTAGGASGPYAIQLKQNQASAQRMGLAQIVENLDSHPMRGRAVRLQFNAKCSTTTTLRYALLEWTGTADSVTSDVVNNWASTTYTVNNFFINSTLIIVGTGTTSVGTGFTACSLSGTISASCNNLIVFVWTDGAAAQNVTVDLAELTLCDANLARDWLPEPAVVEEARCLRYFAKYTGKEMGSASSGDRLYSSGNISFSAPMRAAPTLSGASFSANVGNNGTPVLTYSSNLGVNVANTSNNWTTNAIVSFTGAFDAEL